MRLYLFDDARARGWRPFRLTRPVGELLHGCLLLRERAERFWSLDCVGHLAGADLHGFHEPEAPPVVAPGDIPADEDRLLLSSRWVPAWSDPPRTDGPATFATADASVVGWRLPPGAPTPTEDDLLDPTSDLAPERTIEVEGSLLERPWELVTRNAERIRDDVGTLFPHSHAFLPPHADRIGDEHPVSVGDDVTLEPGVVLDTRKGPVRLADGVAVRAHTRLEGPVFVGQGSTVLGGQLSGVSVGPVCKVQGEIEESVVLGHANKAHGGYLGHAYLGRWVNLGAMTTNSDLKNNYGTIRLHGPDGVIDTGLLKLGCLVGDHAKTGIGTLLNTGTVVGAGSNVYGAAMPPKYVPPFSWGSGRELDTYRLEDFLETAETVMARRDVELGDGMRSLLERAWESTREEREGRR